MNFKLPSLSKPAANVLMSMAILSFATHAIGAANSSDLSNPGISYIDAATNTQANFSSAAKLQCLHTSR
ncbi:hypothetical protein [Arenicella xantha]|uniref:Uncharacterized protein n=1 Tax=Arenicella xantha TaxID=644221 RepID=A0A395JIG1_9GAMM|nr:hypothetical protein [Arenicella xantha]RBP49920.1 hypothetical protein DFR28_103352 [Arenicella xantha]